MQLLLARCTTRLSGKRALIRWTVFQLAFQIDTFPDQENHSVKRDWVGGDWESDLVVVADRLLIAPFRTGIVWWTWKAACQTVRAILSDVCLDTWQPGSVHSACFCQMWVLLCSFWTHCQGKGMSCLFYTCWFGFFYWNNFQTHMSRLLESRGESGAAGAVLTGQCLSVSA